jgi:general secretion pathway protein D
MPPISIATPRRRLDLKYFHLTAIASSIFFSGCASIQHTKGLLELEFDRPDDGIQSLENATQKDARNAAYKIDYLLARDDVIQKLLTDADNLRSDSKLVEARAAYERVLKLDRGNLRAKQALSNLPQDARYDKLLTQGEVFLQQGNHQLALDRASQVLEEHPSNRRALKIKEKANDAKAEGDLARTKASVERSILDAPVTLHFSDATLRAIFESLAKSTGINILFDRDVKQMAKATIFVKDVSVSDAIDLILLQNQLQKHVINGNTMMIYPSNSAKEAEYEDLTIRSFRVTNSDIKYLSSMLKSMLKLKEVAADERTGVLVIRDTPERLRLAERLIAVHDVPEPEIMLEVQVLEVSATRNSNLGIKPPGSFSLSTPVGAAGSLTLGQLRTLTSGDLLTTPLSTTLNFKLEDADAKLLASPRIRAKNKEKAKIMIGDRVPTVTNTVTPVSTGSAVVTGAVTYQDVGLKLEFEPQVYGDSEVGIKINLEVSNIAQAFTDAQGGRSYQIGTRNATTNLRLKDGETQILGGLITDQDRNTASLIPGLGHLPLIGKLFGNNDDTSTRSEIILAITPHIVRNIPVNTPDTKNIFSGTANVLRERAILAEPVTQLKVSGTFGSSPSIPGQPTTDKTVLQTPFLNNNGASPGINGQALINPLPSAPLAAPFYPAAPGGPALSSPPAIFVRPMPGAR